MFRFHGRVTRHKISAVEAWFCLVSLIAIAITLAQPFECAAQTSADEIVVEVSVDHGQVMVDARFTVAASVRDAWAVMTDFNHMAEFISNLEMSRIVSRSGEPLRIEQKGKAARGLLSFSFESVRDVTLVPFESIHTRLISGNLKKLEGYTRLEKDGERTRIVFHGESIPSMWIPPAIGPAFIRRETREQFEELRAEILRRKSRSS